MSGTRLTTQQKRAMHAFLRRDGFDTETTDAAVWDCGVRPWPTMENIAKKGLVVAECWYGSEDGWSWRLTDAGREYMAALAMARSAAR
jgi:hypothetical protein